MTKQNETLLTTINRLCAVEEEARELLACLAPQSRRLDPDQGRALLNLQNAIRALDTARGEEGKAI